LVDLLHDHLILVVWAPAESSSPDAAEGLFETEQRLEAGRIPEAAPLDRAGILDEVDRGGRHGGEPEAEEAPDQAACERLGAAPPVSRMATLSGTAPGPTTLKMPLSPASSAPAIASATSSSWMNCIMGLKPMIVGTHPSFRYVPIALWT